MSDRFAMELAGVDLPALESREYDPSDDLRALRQVLDGQAPRGPARVRPMPAPSPVYRSPQGDEFTTLPTSHGPRMTPWVSGSPIDLETERPSNGGFISRESMTQQQAAAKPRNQPSPEQLRAAMILAMLETGMIRLPADVSGAQGRGASGKTASRSGRAPGKSDSAPAGGGEEAPAKSGDKKPSIGDSIEDALPGIIEGQLVSLAANAWVDGALTNAALGGSLLGTVSGIGGAALMTIAMNMLGGDAPDASSSTFEWVKATLAPKLVGKVMSMGNMAKYFGMGPDKPFPIRISDVDALGNMVLQGSPDVLIEGCNASRDGDAAAAPGTLVNFGAKTVLMNGKFAAQVKDTWSCVAPFLQSGACRTQIGGPTTNPAPSPPDELVAWAKELGIDPSDAKTHNPNDPRPTEPGLYYNPTEGDWRIWDGKGWSSTLSEYENLADWGIFGSPFEAGRGFSIGEMFGMSQTQGHWYLLGGLIDLGSPRFPGAGTGSTWFVPDVIFGYDMSSLYTPHDWIFDPSNPAHAKDPGAVWDDENEAYFSLDSSDPIHWFLQTVYSSATRTAGMVAWFESYMQSLDADAGLPDQYGQSPHLRDR